MPRWTTIGESEKDFGLSVNFHKHRAIVKANTSRVEGIELELIPPGVSGLSPAMILISRDWNDLYFLIERDGWVEADYFAYAQKRFKELGVKEP